MGRGRQKAKQMKVARKLKYFSPETDLGALQRELSGTTEDELEDDEESPEEESPATEDYWDEDSWVAPGSH